MKKNPQPFVITEFQIKTRSHQSLKHWKAKCWWGNGVCKREDPSLPCVGGTPGLAPSPAASLHRDWGWVLGCRLRASPSPSRYRHLGNELMDGSSSCLRRKINNFLEISHCWTKAKGIGQALGWAGPAFRSWLTLGSSCPPLQILEAAGRTAATGCCHYVGDRSSWPLASVLAQTQLLATSEEWANR